MTSIVSRNVPGGSGSSSSSPSSAQWNARTLTGAGTAAAGDFCFLDTTSATFAVAAPSPAVAGTRWGVKWVAGAAAPTLTGTFSGTPTFTALAQVMQFVSNGTAWYQAERPALAELPDYPALTDARYSLANAAVSAVFNGLRSAVSLSGSAAFQANGNGSTNGYPGWAFDSASAEIIAILVELPQHWTATDIDLIWANFTTGTGDVAWRLDYATQKAAGSDLKAAGEVTNGVTVNVTAGAADVEMVTTLKSGLALAANKLLWVRLNRRAADVGDTLPNDAIAVGLRFKQAF